jgi:septum formation protein
VKTLILASSSVYRQKLMQRFMLPFKVISPGIDETALQESGLAPESVALQLAEAKAKQVLGRNRESIVLGSDQLVNLDGEILGKPGNQARAVEQLQKLSGKTHQLITAIVLVSAQKQLTHIDTTLITMRELNPQEILKYVRQDNPVDCAGSYKIEQLGTTLLTSIETKDPAAIEGLPLIALGELLRQFGFALP